MDSVLLVAELVDGTVLLIEDDRDDTFGVFLLKYQTDGSVFDTWHRTTDEAKEQAAQQFGPDPIKWLNADQPAAAQRLATIQARPSSISN